MPWPYSSMVIPIDLAVACSCGLSSPLELVPVMHPSLQHSLYLIWPFWLHWIRVLGWPMVTYLPRYLLVHCILLLPFLWGYYLHFLSYCSFSSKFLVLVLPVVSLVLFSSCSSLLMLLFSYSSSVDSSSFFFLVPSESYIRSVDSLHFLAQSLFHC